MTKNFTFVLKHQELVDLAQVFYLVSHLPCNCKNSEAPKVCRNCDVADKALEIQKEMTIQMGKQNCGQSQQT